MDFDPRTYGDLPLLQVSPIQAAEEHRQKFLSAFYRETIDNLVAALLPSADPSELAIAVDQPAPEKPIKFHDDMTHADWRRGCDAVMRPKWMEY